MMVKTSCYDFIRSSMFDSAGFIVGVIETISETPFTIVFWRVGGISRTTAATSSGTTTVALDVRMICLLISSVNAGVRV